MKINFDIAEHFYLGDEFSWISSLLITLIGTFLGFLLVLILDKLVDRRNQKRKEIEESNKKLDVLKYLKSILDALLIYIPKQTRNIKNFSDELKKSPLEIVHPEILATYDLMRLRNADNVNTQDAYINFFQDSENPFKDYKNLFAHGDYLMREMDSIEKQTERAIYFKHKDQLAVRDILEELSFILMNRMQELFNENGRIEVQAMKNEEYSFMSSIADSYVSIIQEMMIFSRVREEIVDQLLQKSLTLIKHEELKIRVLELARKAHSRLVNIQGNSEHFANDIGNLDKRVEDALNYLKLESKKLDKIITRHNTVYIPCWFQRFSRV